MKVLFLLTYYYPHWTGLTQYARRLAEALADKKYNVSVLTIQHQPGLKLKENVKKVHVLRKTPQIRLSRTFISFGFFTSLFSEIQKHDRVIVYLPFAEVLLAAVFARLFRKKIYLVHNGDLNLPRGIAKPILEWFYYTTTGLAVRLSDGIIIQTEDYARSSKLLSKYKKKWKEIFPLYDAIQMNPQNRLLLEKKLLKRKKYTIGFAGRFVEEKGFDILLKAIPHVLSQISDVQFVFAGETNMVYENFFITNKELIEENKEHLVLLGVLNNDEMAAFYRICDVFVISSRSDCFPSTEIESLLAGTPVVVTDIPGARWPAQKTGMGIVIKSEDPKALAQGIVEVIRNKQKYKKQKEKAATLFDNKRTLMNYEQLLKI